MKPIIQYLKCIFASHRYMLFSIPIIAIIVFGAGLYFISKPVWLAMLSNKELMTSDALVNLSHYQFLNWTVAMVVLLPFLHLFFLSKVYYQSYDFTIPISVIQKWIVYMVIALLIFIYNYLIAILLNYMVEWIFNNKYHNAILNAFDKKGLLYTKIELSTIFNTGKLSWLYYSEIKLFLIILPFFFFANLYFKKYSVLISAALFLILTIAGVGISNTIWEGYYKSISNPIYTSIYYWAPQIMAIILAYVAFYYFLKEKEV